MNTLSNSESQSNTSNDDAAPLESTGGNPELQAQVTLWKILGEFSSSVRTRTPSGGHYYREVWRLAKALEKTSPAYIFEFNKVITIRCIVCGSGRGKSCTEYDGKRRKTLHFSRFLEYGTRTLWLIYRSPHKTPYQRALTRLSHLWLTATPKEESSFVKTCVPPQGEEGTVN
jgi:hypothetical protein